MITITEDYVSFETAKLLKEKGFDEICYLGYNKNGEYVPTSNRNNSQIIQPDFCFICCPTLQMAMKWLREVHNLQIQIAPITLRHNNAWTFGIDRDFSPLTIDLLCFPTYEEGCEVAIKYCLENLI